MEGMLITDINVWFGIREPEWWPEDDEEFEESFKPHEKKTFRKALKIRRK